MSVRAAVQAGILLGIVLDLPVVAPLVRRLTGSPQSERVDVDRVPVEVVRPPGQGPWPAWVFVNGAHPLRRREPVVARLVEGLARAGFLVVAPDVPGLGDGTVTARSVEATHAVVAASVERPDVRNGQVALVGASTGAGLALLAASSPRVAGRISVVAAVVPFADLRKLICLATTSAYEEDGRFARFEVTDLHRLVVARSLAATLPEAAEREQLLAALAEIEREALNPLEELPRRGEPRSGEARAVLRLLANRDPERFGELFDALPQPVRAFVGELSPLRACRALGAPVEIVVPPLDTYFAPGEARSLITALPQARLTVTRVLDHTRPTASLAGLRGLIALLGFALRGIEAAGRRPAVGAPRLRRKT